MTLLRSLGRFFSVPPDKPELIQSQAHGFTRQIPLLYAILLINTTILAATHQSSAPLLLTTVIPTILGLFCVARLIQWWRCRQVPISDIQARRMLNRSVAGGAVLGFLVCAWALGLYPYGDAAQQAHVAFYVGTTLIGCVVCLMHSRAAAVTVALAMMVPIVGFILLQGSVVHAAMAMNLAVVVAALLFVTFLNFRTFAELVAARVETAGKQAETLRLSDENNRLANIDQLTGLPNRRRFDQALQAMLAQANVDGANIAVARLDIDGFKSVNSIFGHATGDRVLLEVAHRVMALRSASTFVARLEADVFGLILQGPISQERLALCGETLCATMRQPLELPDANLHISASAGFAASLPHDSAEALCDRADYAIFVAKQEARGTGVVFSERHARDISRVRALEHALHTADLDAEIYILFQPQFDTTLNRTTGYEVLARWRHPVLGEVSPVDFIPMAERIGVISKITQTVLRKALLMVEQLPRPLRLSVNLSANDLASHTAIEAIVALVGQFGTPCRIDFEITETSVMRDMKQANTALLSLLSLGSRIALDDFGTGHSSLTYVQKLPLDRIKVDRSFVAEVTSDPTSRAIIKTTVDLCRNLGISCVFEGIETEEQLNVLLGLGGKVMQGYLFGRPMSEAMVLQHHAREARGDGIGVPTLLDVAS
ncbi:MAG TPA: EAL domain-containing protein [Devosia sp.]|nr:EAL domain-containing protein [Devosia sp.]